MANVCVVVFLVWWVFLVGLVGVFLCVCLVFPWSNLEEGHGRMGNQPRDLLLPDWIISKTHLAFNPFYC